ncbi:MAG: putative ABC transporter permease, partial [Bacilli bacterium]|nr:putative ABC transporter permease [Bacilli bacterium]
VIPLHLGKYVSIPTSLLWATFALLYLYKIKDITDQLIKKIPKWLTILLSTIFIIDLILTLVKLFTIKSL